MMADTKAAQRAADQALLDAVRGFARTHPAKDIDRFLPALCAEPDSWQMVEPSDLPASKTLAAAGSRTDPATHAIWSAFADAQACSRWEQSYTKADGLVGDDMLNGYGFIEIIGKRGPFLSTQVRSGIGVWGPNITYPRHRHQAEEIYVGIAGAADFTLGVGGHTETRRAAAGDAVYVAPQQPHGFVTTDELFVVFYIWQAGDMREVSKFG